MTVYEILPLLINCDPSSLYPKCWLNLLEVNNPEIHRDSHQPRCNNLDPFILKTADESHATKFSDLHRVHVAILQAATPLAEDPTVMWLGLSIHSIFRPLCPPPARRNARPFRVQCHKCKRGRIWAIHHFKWQSGKNMFHDEGSNHPWFWWFLRLW